MNISSGILKYDGCIRGVIEAKRVSGFRGQIIWQSWGKSSRKLGSWGNPQ